MAYQELFKFDGTTNFVPDKKKSTPKKASERGCDFCPMNEVKGVNKVKNLDKIQGKAIMLWAQNPGMNENREGKELIGNAGKFLWTHAKSVGLTREDCDIQNVVRCLTATRNDLKQLIPHNPTKEEIHACSIYNEEAIKLNGGNVKVHIVLGQVAASALLRGEYRKGQNTFFSKKLNAWVICTYHPAYFLRGAPRSKIDDFRLALRTAVEKANMKRGKFAYLKEQDYASVPGKSSTLRALEKELLEAAEADEFVAVDVEDGFKDGKNVIVYVGFSTRKGYARGIFLDHAKLKQSKEALQRKLAFLKKVLENGKIKKVLHHGVYDVWKLRRLLGIRVKGIRHDTTFSEYLRFSWTKAYGLAAIADRRFQMFAGYKTMLAPYADKTTKRVNFYEIPRKVVVIYNGADCDLTGRIARSNKGKVNERLLKLMIRVAHPMARMEENGPIFDFEHSKVLEAWIPKKVDALKQRLRDISKVPELNPNAAPQLAAIIYDKLKLGKHLEDAWKEEHPRSTGKETMGLLGNFSIFPTLVVQYRKFAKKKGTYLVGFRKSAEIWGGRLRTKWWLTGTITCRLRSGGDKDEKAKNTGIVNLQNVDGDPAIENLLVSDLNWRQLYQDWENGRKEKSVRGDGQRGQTAA